MLIVLSSSIWQLLVIQSWSLPTELIRVRLINSAKYSDGTFETLSQDLSFLKVLPFVL